MLKSIKNAIAKSRICRPSNSRPATSRGVRLQLEGFEGRAVPANLTVTYAAASHTLTVIGDNNANDLTIQGDRNDSTHFTLTSAGTINNGPQTFVTPSGVQNMTIRLLDGDDKLTFGNLYPTHLNGGLKIDGGDGANTISGIGMFVENDLAIRNGTGVENISFTDLSVAGSLTVRNRDGGGYLSVLRTLTGVSATGGSVRVTNGTGAYGTSLRNVDVGGSVIVHNGHADASG